MRELNEIIIHCSATKPEWMANAKTAFKVQEIKRWHVQDRGWNDIGYHYLIDRDGTVATGRHIATVGAHVQGHNTGTIGICLIGGHGSSATDAFADHFTAKQNAALIKLIADLCAKYSTITTVSGHNQYAAKACPGFNAPKWYATALPTASAAGDTSPGVSAPSIPGGTSSGLIAAIIAILRGLFGGKK